MLKGDKTLVVIGLMIGTGLGITTTWIVASKRINDATIRVNAAEREFATLKQTARDAKNRAAEQESEVRRLTDIAKRWSLAYNKLKSDYDVAVAANAELQKEVTAWRTVIERHDKVVTPIVPRKQDELPEPVDEPERKRTDVPAERGAAPAGKPDGD